jgi:predicted deacetylase
MNWTPAKMRLTKAIGPRWTMVRIARQAGLFIQQVEMELRCTEDATCDARHVPQVQEAIAKVIGLSVKKLFGRHAWFKLNGKRAATRRAERLRLLLQPCSTRRARARKVSA